MCRRLGVRGASRMVYKYYRVANECRYGVSSATADLDLVILVSRAWLMAQTVLSLVRIPHDQKGSRQRIGEVNSPVRAHVSSISPCLDNPYRYLQCQVRASRLK